MLAVLTAQSCLQSCPATGWSLRVWPCALQRCPLCSQQDSRHPTKAGGLVRAAARCLQAVCRLPKRCCMDGAWSMLLIWGLHTYRCISTLRLVSLLRCVRLSFEAAPILLNASTAGNDTWPTEKWPVHTLLRAVSFAAAWWLPLYPCDEALMLLGLFWAPWFSDVIIAFLCGIFFIFRFVWSIRNNLRHGFSPPEWYFHKK